MKLKVCCIRDRAIDTYGNPFFVTAHGQAMRSFVDEINNKNKDGNTLATHPDDFDLYALGEYDTDTGLFDCNAPSMLATGKSCVSA